MILVYREPIKAEKKDPMARKPLGCSGHQSNTQKGRKEQLIRYGRDLIALHVPLFRTERYGR